MVLLSLYRVMVLILFWSAALTIMILICVARFAKMMVITHSRKFYIMLARISSIPLVQCGSFGVSRNKVDS